MKNKYDSPVPRILEKCCQTIMILIIVIATLLLIILHTCEAFHLNFEISSKGFKDYISLYGEYGIPQLIGIFLVTLTSQIYLEQLKVSKIGFINAENLAIHANWEQRVDNWLLSTSNLQDSMRNVLQLSKQNIYKVLLKYNFNISNEDILSEILNLYSSNNFRDFENFNPISVKNNNRYYLKNYWYSLDNFYVFICIISDSQYNGAYQQCLNHYAMELPKELVQLPTGSFEMLKSEV